MFLRLESMMVGGRPQLSNKMRRTKGRTIVVIIQVKLNTTHRKKEQKRIEKPNRQKERKKEFE